MAVGATVAGALVLAGAMVAGVTAAGVLVSVGDTLIMVGDILIMEDFTVHRFMEDITILITEVTDMEITSLTIGEEETPII